MTTEKEPKAKQTRKLLVGFSEADLKTIERAAEACEIKRATFIQDAAVYWAEKLGGVK